MAELDKVIKGLECCASKDGCKGCPYSQSNDCHVCTFNCIGDALSLLKEQEAVVRCKDCGYWENTTEGRYVGGWCFCDRLKFSTSPDWFCADGVKEG